MNWTKKIINSWSEFTEFVDSLEVHNSYLSFWSFRGQSNSKWTISSSLMRIIKRHKLNKIDAENFEMTLYREFISKSHTYKEIKIRDFESGDKIVWWMIMQHYGCPTRLLDWTDSPYVALYFAVESSFEDDGAVYLFNNRILDKKNKEAYPEIDFFEQFDSLKNEGIVQGIISNFHSERSIAQQGCFTISTDITLDHDDIPKIIGSEAEKCCYNLIIKKDIKYEILARLKTMNISANSLFPDLVGFGKALKDLVEIRCWEKNR